jgi:hypothetical protein
MIFLIDYDRASGKIVSMRHFGDDNGNAAADARLHLELDLKRQRIEREIVLLEASSEDALRRTHRRYFEDMHELASPAPGNTFNR